jgi:hypothetical protein
MIDNGRPASRYVITVNGEEIDHADTRAAANRARDAIINGGIGTMANTAVTKRPQAKGNRS